MNKICLLLEKSQLCRCCGHMHTAYRCLNHTLCKYVGYIIDDATMPMSPFFRHVYRKIYKKKFENMIIYISMHSFISIAKESNPFFNLDKEKIYHECNIDVLDLMYHQVLAYASENETILLL